MDTNSNSKSIFLKQLDTFVKQGKIPVKVGKNLQDFFHSYCQELAKYGVAYLDSESLFLQYLDLLKKEIETPYPFEPYHQQLRSPFDYYAFGIHLLKPLVDLEKSSALGLDHLQEMTTLLKQGANVVLFANHQIEADPHAIGILLEKVDPVFASSIIFVAGERVITDFLAIPFSLGTNLLCIYSKRYIDHPPEKKHQKQLHNKKTMEKMSALFKEGGKCIYVAPSGGRDRPNATGEIEVAPFDPQSIEMFYLMAKRAKTPTYFYPLALATYSLLPPPKTIQIELGEERTTQRGAIHLAFGPQIDMEHFQGSEAVNKHEQRKVKAAYICNLVKKEYTKFFTRS